MYIVAIFIQCNIKLFSMTCISCVYYVNDYYTLDVLICQLHDDDLLYFWRDHSLYQRPRTEEHNDTMSIVSDVVFKFN